jgi:type I restriction enzyme, S subunit
VTVIGDVVRRVGTWNPSRAASAEPFAYVDLSSVDQDAKHITAARSTRPAEAPSRARQLIERGDVLVSTVRPNLNAVAHVGDEFHGATASTGFTVLRPSDRLDGRYLFHWVQTPEFVRDMVGKATGASYPAVSDRIVKESSIPLPPIEEQRYIAAILDRAHSLSATSVAAVDRHDVLLAAIFRGMFGDIERAMLEARCGTFGDHVLELQGGRNLVASDPTAETPFRVLKISAVTSGVYRPTESKPLPRDYVPDESHLVRSGDLLMSRANTTAMVGATALVRETPSNLALPDKLWRIVWRDPTMVQPTYMAMLLQTPAIRRALSARSSGTGGSMKNISKAKLMLMPLPVAAPEAQAEFAEVAGLIERSKCCHVARRDAVVALAGTLQARAFSGRL